MYTRSAKSAANAKIQKALAKSYEDMGSDGFESDLTEISEDEEEKTTKSRRTSTNRAGPAAKKSKTSSESPKKLSVAKPGRGRSLSVLVTMPLDILFEVFGHLSPKDLTSLSRTTKTLRKTLLSKSATSVWMTSRTREGAPAPPADVSEPQWAALIFGHTCMGCGTTNIHTIDFLLRRRVCTNCKKRNLLVKHRVKKEFPDIDEAVLTYVSATNVGGWAHGQASNSQFWWKSDIEDMLHTLAKYEANVRSRKKGAKQALEDFKAERVKTVQEMHEGAHAFNNWVSSAAHQRHLEIADAQNKRRDEIIRRFVELGYEEKDVTRHNWTFSEEWKKKGEITDKVWTRIRAKMEAEIQKTQQERLEAANRQVRERRRALLAPLFKAYKMTVPPAQWPYLPTADLLSRLPPFKTIIEGDPQVEVTAANFASSMANIAETLATAKDELKARLTQRAVEFYQSQQNSETPSTVEGSSNGEGGSSSSASLDPAQLFALATTVFKCELCNRSVYGWDDISSHFCTSPGMSTGHPYHFLQSTSKVDSQEYPYKFVIDAERANFVKAVIKMAGRDPARVTAAEMNAIDLRLTCCKCDSESTSANPSLSWAYSYRADRFKDLVYNWRTLTDHIANQHSQAASNVKFTALSPQVSDLVRLHERQLNHGSGYFWACTRCDAHLTSSVRISDIKKHAQEKHDNASPVEGVDFIWLPRIRTEHSFKRTVVQQHTKALRTSQKLDPKQLLQLQNSIQPHQKPAFKWPVKCAHCQISKYSSGASRLFMLDAVKSHIKAKHELDSFARDVDYLVVAKSDIPKSWKDKYQPMADNLEFTA